MGNDGMTCTLISGGLTGWCVFVLGTFMYPCESGNLHIAIGESYEYHRHSTERHEAEVGVAKGPFHSNKEVGAFGGH